MLTGRTRYRIGFRKKLVLQVEVWVHPALNYGLRATAKPWPEWRDATIEDMQAIERGEVQTENPGPRRNGPLRPNPDSRNPIPQTSPVR